MRRERRCARAGIYGLKNSCRDRERLRVYEMAADTVINQLAHRVL